MALPRLSGEFRLFGEPKLEFTPSGLAVCNLRIVASDQKKNEQTQKYDDTETLWITAILWRDTAEHAANSFKDKDLITIAGAKPYVRNYETKDGEKKQAFELKFDHESSIGPSLRFRTTPHSDQQAAAPAGQGQQWGNQPQAQPQAQPQWGGQPQGQPAYGQPQGQPQYAQPQGQPGGYPPQGQPGGYPPQGQPQGQPNAWPPSEI